MNRDQGLRTNEKLVHPSLGPPILVPAPLARIGVWGRDLLGRLIGDRPFERPWMVEYIDKVLSAGSSKPPVEILKDAGVDMTTAEPFRAFFRAMDETISEIEKILDDGSFVELDAFVTHRCVETLVF